MASPEGPPDAEFLAHTKTSAGSRFCRFYNLSCGCNQDGCRFEHKCPLCNKEHRPPLPPLTVRDRPNLKC